MLRSSFSCVDRLRYRIGDKCKLHVVYQGYAYSVTLNLMAESRLATLPDVLLRYAGELKIEN
jgi:hypothetical protein